MKIIKYKLLVSEVNRGTAEEPNIEQVFVNKEILCSASTFDSNVEIAKREAHHGEYTVEEIEENGEVSA